MKRLIVKYREGHCNLTADTIVDRDGMIYAYIGDSLIGIFDPGCIDMLYLSEVKTEGAGI